MNLPMNLFGNQQKISYLIVLSISIYMVNLIKSSVPMYSEGFLVNSLIVHHNKKFAPCLVLEPYLTRGNYKRVVYCLCAHRVRG